MKKVITLSFISASMLFALSPIHDKMDLRIKGKSFSGTMDDSSAAQDGLGILPLQSFGTSSEIINEVQAHKVFNRVLKRETDTEKRKNIRLSLETGTTGEAEDHAILDNFGFKIKYNPGTLPSCEAIKQTYPLTTTNGNYLLSDGTTANCDMNTDGGGWRISTISDIINKSYPVSTIRGYTTDKKNRIVDYRGRASAYKWSTNYSNAASTSTWFMHWSHCTVANDNCASLYRNSYLNLPFTIGSVAHKIDVRAYVSSYTGDADSSRVYVNSEGASSNFAVDTGYGNWPGTATAKTYTLRTLNQNAYRLRLRGWCSRAAGAHCDGAIIYMNFQLDSDLPALTTTVLSK